MTNHILLVSEYFPPAIGGSAELLSNIYFRLGSGVTVLTRTVDNGLPSTVNAATEVSRIRFPAGLGLLAPTALVDTTRLTWRIRGLASNRSVVHCGRALPEGTAAWLYSLATRTPYVCWTHGEELPIAAGSRELRWLLRRVHQGAAALIANSYNTARLLEALGNRPERIHVVHPAVDAERFKPDHAGRASLRRRLARDGELLLLSVGRLQARKGHDLVLKALASLAVDTAPIRYIIAGSGDDEGRLRALATELGLTHRVDFVGAVSPDELPTYYAAADIFVHPNRTEGEDFEGFGIVFLEAAATGLPVIGGRTGGVPEAVAEGKTGLLVSGTDPHELRAAIEQLASSPTTRADFGSAARRRVLADFTWERATNQLRAIDDRVRGGSSPGRSS